MCWQKDKERKCFQKFNTNVMRFVAEIKVRGEDDQNLTSFGTFNIK